MATMILRTTFSASLMMHVAVAAIAFGHGPAPGVIGRVSTVDVVDVEPITVPEVASTAPPPADLPKGAATLAATLPAHRHSYPVPPTHDAHPHDSSLVHLPVAPPAGDPAMTATPFLDAPKAEPARFVLATGSAPFTVGASAPTGAHGGDDGAAGSTEIVPESAVTVPARLLANGAVAYPAAARQAEVEADVPVSIVVDRDGRVVEARALSRSGYGLDDAAVQAVRGYRFSGALREGHRVRVRMRWVVQFRLR